MYKKVVDPVKPPKNSVSSPRSDGSKIVETDQKSPFESTYMRGWPESPRNPGMMFPVESAHEMPGPFGPCGPVAPVGPGAPVIPIGP